MSDAEVKFRNRLEVKFLTFFLSLTVVVCISFFGLYESWLLRGAYDNLDQKQRQFTQYFSVISAEWLWNLDREHLQTAMASAIQDQLIAGIRIMDEKGDVFMEEGSFLAEKNYNIVERDIVFHTDAASEYLGKVLVAFSDNAIWDNFRQRIIRDGFLIAIIVVTAVVGAMYVNRRTVTNPLKRMIETLECCGGSELPQKIEWNSKDEIGVVIASFNDLLRRRQRALEKNQKMERELQQAQKLEAVGQLAGGIAHEINTPAQYIGDNLRFIKESQEDLFRFIEEVNSHLKSSLPPEQLQEIEALSSEIELDFLLDELPSAISQSQEGIRQVSKIVTAMKEFSHPGAQEMVPININRSIENALTVSRNEWKNVAQVVAKLDNTLPDIPCLQAEINQVFLNLIINAAHAIIQAGHQGDGEIMVESFQNGNWLEIRISDNGTGIPKEVRNRIFEPFFTTKEVGKGSGQGLSIAYDTVVNKHKGCLVVESEVNKGTCFIISLPFKQQITMSPNGGIEGHSNM